VDAGSLWPRNDSLGLEMLQTAAEAGNVQAKLGMAYRRFKGLGVEEDCDVAFQYDPNPGNFLIQPPFAVFGTLNAPPMSLNALPTSPDALPMSPATKKREFVNLELVQCPSISKDKVGKI
jgi:hypothetical protein